MAVGTVSSAQNLSAAAPATTLMSGEKLATTQAALKAAGAKTYYHQCAGASFFMPNGLQIQFLGGSFTTADKEIIAELDAVADKPTSMITSDRARQAALAAAEKLPAQEVASTAQQ